VRSREIQQFLATITGRPLSEVDQRCRRLRESLDKASTISTGPRGNSAPHQDIASATFHILAMASRRAPEAFEVALRLWDSCVLIDHPSHPGLTDAFKERGVDARRISVFLLFAMTGGLKSIGFEFNSFEFSDDGHMAWVDLDRRTLKNVRFLFSTSPEEVSQNLVRDPDEYRRYDREFAGGRFVIGAHHLRTLGDRIALDMPHNVASEDA
jgi:hypothetical protein